MPSLKEELKVGRGDKRAPARIGEWYKREREAGLVSNVILTHVLSEKIKNVGDPFSKVKHMELFFKCREYQIISNDEGVFVSITNEELRASDFTIRYTQYSLAKDGQFRRCIRLLFGGRPIVEAEYD